MAFTEIKRIGTIQFRLSTTLNEKKYFEIVKIEPNKFWGHENDYEKIDNEWYQDRETKAYISSSCFKNSESAFTIADFSLDSDYIAELHFCGDRPFSELSKDEFEDFIEIAKFGYEYIKSFFLSGDDETYENFLID